MRNRFRPNVTPRSGRRSGPSNTTISTSAPEAVEPQTVEEPAVFIPPNSSRAETSVASPDLESNTVLNVENETASKDSSPVPKSPTTGSTTSTRRSRIKPSITPSTRTRNKPTSREVKAQEANEVLPYNIETVPVAGEEVISTTPESTITVIDTSPSKDDTINTASENHSATTPQKALPQLVTQTEKSNETAVSSFADAEGNQTSSGSVLPRRKRAIPNIGVAARRRQSVSLPKDGTPDKGTCQSESSVSHGHQIEETPDKNISENDTIEDRISKRPRTAPELPDNNISIIEVTVQTDTSEVQPEVEEIVEEDEEEEQTIRKVEERKKKRAKYSRPKEPLDPSKMTLQDLIYFNPKGNPMKSSVHAKRKRIEEKRKSSRPTASENGDGSVMEVDGEDPADQTSNNKDQNREDNVDTSSSALNEGGDEDRVCAPQVKIGADGCIILDEESLVIQSSTNNTLQDTDIVYEDSNDLNYAYFKQSKRSKWSMQETMKFYKALSQVGTDFSLMGPLFPKRKRKELKAKFKREEKFHEDLVNRALVHRTPISVEMFVHHEQTEEEVLNEVTSGNDDNSTVVIDGNT